MVYGILSGVCGLLSAGLGILGLLGLVAPDPSMEFVFLRQRYELLLRWAGLWALLAALYAWCGHRYFLHRAEETRPDPVDLLFSRAAGLLTGAYVLALLYAPRIIR